MVYKEKAQYCPGEVCDVKSRQDIQKTSGSQLLIVVAFIVYMALTVFLFNGTFSEKSHNLFGAKQSDQSK